LYTKIKGITVPTATYNGHHHPVNSLHPKCHK